MFEVFQNTDLDPRLMAKTSNKNKKLYIELSKLEFKPDRLSNKMFDAWMKFISDPNRFLSENREIAQLPEFQEAIKLLECISGDENMRRLALRRKMFLMDQRAAEREQRAEGKAEGRAEGIEEGMARGAAERDKLLKEIAMLKRELARS